MIEVEAKFLIPDSMALEQAILACTDSHTITEYHQRDEYFNHPCRDFGATDEALRIRNCNGRLQLTYKGPRLDAITKTREEVELQITADDASDSEKTLQAILLSLGFRNVGCVTKHRRSFTTIFEDTPVTVSIDRVFSLPPYAEIEVTCDASSRETATDTILRLANTLGLKHSERRSYLELLGGC